MDTKLRGAGYKSKSKKAWFTDTVCSNGAAASLSITPVLSITVGGCNKSALPTVIGNGYLSTSEELYEQMEAVRVYCHDGYEIIGATHSYCEDGVFTPATFECRKSSCLYVCVCICVRLRVCAFLVKVRPDVFKLTFQKSRLRRSHSWLNFLRLACECKNDLRDLVSSARLWYHQPQTWLHLHNFSWMYWNYVFKFTISTHATNSTRTWISRCFFSASSTHLK